MAARGVRNRNPGNLRHGPAWQGLAPQQTDPDFAQFTSMEFGIGALVLNLRTYVTTHGLRSVRGIINRWAPPNENDTSAYVQSVAGVLGVDPDKHLTFDDTTLMRLAQAIAAHENGNDASQITAEQWARGFAMATGADLVFEPEPATAPRPAPAVPAAVIGAQPMDPISLAVASAIVPKLLEILPWYAKGAQAQKNVRAVQAIAPTLIEAAKAASAANTAEEAAQKVATDPVARERYVQAVAPQWETIARQLTPDEESRREARSFAERMTSSGPRWRRGSYAITLAVLGLLVVGGGGYVVWQLLMDPNTDASTKGQLVGLLQAAILAVLYFFYGSAAGSRAKDATREIEAEARVAQAAQTARRPARTDDGLDF